MSNLDSEFGPVATDTPGAPVVTNKLRYDFDDTGITVSTAYVTIYSYTGSGKFFEAVLDFDSNQVEVKLTVDATEVIFELTADELQDVQIPGAAGQEAGVGGLLWETAGSRLRIRPPHGIYYTSEIKFEARRTGVVDKNLSRYLVSLTKES